MLRKISNSHVVLYLIVILVTVLSTACSTGIQYNKVASNSNVRLGIEYLTRGNGTDAKRSLMLALKEDPNSDAAWYAMGYFFEATGNEKTAETYYLQAVKKNRTSGIPNNNYGTFLCRRGRYKAAIQQFLIAAKNPNYINVGQAYENAGLCALLIPNRKLAQAYFIQALKNSPKLDASLLEFAKIQYREGKIRKAKGLYQRFLQVSKPTGESKQFAAFLYNPTHPKLLPIRTPKKIKRTLVASNASHKKVLRHARASTKRKLESKQPVIVKARRVRKHHAKKIVKSKQPVIVKAQRVKKHHAKKIVKSKQPVIVKAQRVKKHHTKKIVKSKQPVIVKAQRVKKHHAKKIHRPAPKRTITQIVRKHHAKEIYRPLPKPTMTRLTNKRPKPVIAKAHRVRKHHAKNVHRPLPIRTKKIVESKHHASAKPLIVRKHHAKKIYRPLPKRTVTRIARKHHARKTYSPIASRTTPWIAEKPRRTVKRIGTSDHVTTSHHFIIPCTLSPCVKG